MVVSIKRKIKDSFLSAGNSGKNMPDKGAQIRPCNGMGGMAALYRKEMSDHIRSKRFLIVLGLILLTSCASTVAPAAPATPQRLRLIPATFF